MDVAGKLSAVVGGCDLHCCFNPSSNGCGWKTYFAGVTRQDTFIVSILLLMDVAGKLVN